MFRFTEQDRTISSLESSAFADLIFLLLIFFLLSSSFILPTQIPVNPPVSDTPVPTKEDPIVVTLTKDGEAYVGEEKIPFTELPTALGTKLSAATVKSVLIRGDQSVSLGKLVEVMDLARNAGAEKLAIATEQKSKPRR